MHVCVDTYVRGEGRGYIPKIQWVVMSGTMYYVASVIFRLCTFCKWLEALSHNVTSTLEQLHIGILPTHLLSLDHPCMCNSSASSLPERGVVAAVRWG